MLVILGILVCGAGVLCITQWDNIKAVYMGLKYSEDELTQMQTDSKKHFEEISGIDLSKVEEMSKYINPDGTPIEGSQEGSSAEEDPSSPAAAKPSSGQDKPSASEDPNPPASKDPAGDGKKPDAKPLQAYVDVIKARGEEFGIPVLDLFENLGIDPNNEAEREAYTVDGLHFNDAGQAFLAKALGDFLTSL